VLPQPAACLITGITPQHAEQHGVCEAEFMAAIHAELSTPGTCALGYNSLRFDDEFTRYGLYRNLFDPYAREWQNGCSRWDLIDALRTAYALRPEGIEWPRRPDGLPSLRLEDLTRANGLDHGQAHDALSDVQATIALARLLRDRQPRLYQHLFGLRGKQAVAALIDTQAMRPLLHVSGMFGAARAFLALIAPLMIHPVNRNEVLCYDLSSDPTPLLEEPADVLRERLFARAAALPEGVERPALKSVHLNRCPVLLPARMAAGAPAGRAGLDGERCRRHLAQLRAYRERHPGALEAKLRQLSERGDWGGADDPDLQLYGGFVGDSDRRQLEALRRLDPAALAQAQPRFEDARLPTLFFRYRARNWPDSLLPEERERWDTERFSRITEPNDPRVLDLGRYHEDIEQRLAAADVSERDRRILLDLQLWGDALLV
jgi:exodeoxyribonuclease-1